MRVWLREGERMTNAEYAAGLRQLAEWYESHPNAAQPYESNQLHFNVYHRDTVAQVIQDFGGRWEKRASSGLMYFRSTFGQFTLVMYTNHQTVCTARKVGTRTISARPAEPEYEVDVLAWDCQPIMGVTDPTDSPPES